MKRMQDFVATEMPKVTPEILQAACNEGTVNVALDSETNYEKFADEFNDRFPCVKATTTVSEDDDNLSRFIAANNQNDPPDVMALGSDITAKEKLVDAGLMMNYVPSNDNLLHTVAPGYMYDPNHLSQGILYNTKSIKQSDVEQIKEWKDIGKLAGSEFDGKRLGVVDPHGAGGGSYMVAYIMHKEAGNDAVADVLKSRDVTVYAGSGPAVDALASGEIDLVIGNDFNGLAAYDKGAPVQVVYPSPGSNTYTAMGIAQKAAHPNAAKLWIEFIFSKTGQALYPSVLSTAPGRSDVKDSRKAAEADWYRPAKVPFDYDIGDMQASYEAVVASYPSK
jgi:iron(III) transport system substrate-binding protein